MGGPGSGHHVEPFMRRLMYYYYYVLNKTAEEIHDTLFCENPSSLTVERIKQICRFFINGDPEEVEIYLEARRTRKMNAGRRPLSLLDADDKNHLRTILRQRCNRHLKDLTHEFYALLDWELTSMPATCTVFQTLPRMNMPRKVTTRRNIRKDYEAQLDFLDDTKFLMAKQIFALDGIQFNPQDNIEKFGWALVGHEAQAYQICVENRTFAVHAAMVEHGFCAWEIFESNVCGTDVAEFIRVRVAPLFRADSFLLLDNAKNQNTDEVIDTMEECLGGRYFYNVAYSPELNPISRGFSMLRCWIRDHEQESRGDPISLINRGFHLYSIEGPWGYKCYNLFDMYRLNHARFLDECI